MLLRSLLLLFSSLPLSLFPEIPMKVLASLSPHLSSEISYSDLCSCYFPSFPTISFKRFLCRFSTRCLPVCLQRPVTQISALALFLSSLLSLLRDPYVGSPLSVSPSVFRDLLLRSLVLLLSSRPLSLFQEIPVQVLHFLSPCLSSETC